MVNCASLTQRDSFDTIMLKKKVCVVKFTLDTLSQKDLQ